MSNSTHKLVGENIRSTTLSSCPVTPTTTKQPQPLTPPQLYLPMPPLLPMYYRRAYTGVRPVRVPYNRLEMEIIGNSTISSNSNNNKNNNNLVVIHNYGHGGQGVSLAFGCAEQVSKMIQQYQKGKGSEGTGDNKGNKSNKGNKDNKGTMETKGTMEINGTNNTKICIIGGGIIGLSTALLLLKEGYKVTIYQTIPGNSVEGHLIGTNIHQFNTVGGGKRDMGINNNIGGRRDMDNTTQPHSIHPTFNQSIPSYLAPGLWLPYGDYRHPKIDLLSRRSYQILEQIQQQSDRYRDSLRKTWYYDTSTQHVSLPYPLHYRRQLISLNSVPTPMLIYETYQINLPIFMKKLLMECIERGAKIVGMEWGSNHKLDSHIVVNCAGGNGPIVAAKLAGLSKPIEEYRTKSDKKDYPISKEDRLKHPQLEYSTSLGQMTNTNSESKGQTTPYMIGTRGHLLQFANPNPQKYNFFLNLVLPFSRRLKIYCHNDRILCGYTREEGKYQAQLNPNMVQELIEQCQQMVNIYGDLKDKSKL